MVQWRKTWYKNHGGPTLHWYHCLLEMWMILQRRPSGCSLLEMWITVQKRPSGCSETALRLLMLHVLTSTAFIAISLHFTAIPADYLFQHLQHR
mmetsp:Transcript_30608/g.60053  ORF Transcript_30608/g.60053 Transcript_30608/m.60053 type:complete len:94 (+) Transcript_30608:73-354(+)